MLLNKYEVFLRTAEIGNITRTAEALHYTQAGISHAIASLEKETGFPLFIRGSGGVSLTEDGKRLLGAVQSLVNEQNKLEQTINEINGIATGTLRIGTFSSVATHWMPEIIKDFQKKYPEITFDLRFADYDKIAEMILRGQIDCGFLTAPVRDGLDFMPLYRDPMEVLLPQGHPLAAKEKITLDEVKREPLIMQVKGSDNDIRNILGQDKKKYTVKYTMSDDFSVMAMVRSGFGITIFPEMLWSNYKACDALEIRAMEPEQFRIIGIATLPRDEMSVLAKAFTKFMLDRRSGEDPAGI